MHQIIGCLLLSSVAVMWPMAAAPPAPQAADFNGRVFDATSKNGIENLEVKLTPPRQSNLAIRLTSTGRNGEFLFRRLERGRYLLEISQGLYLLYRAEIDTTQQDRLEIPLRRKR
jgi:hypothetical protein